MILLKNGNIDKWIGKCAHCGAIFEASVDELEGGYSSFCLYCNEYYITFYIEYSKEANDILKRNDIEID